MGIFFAIYRPEKVRKKIWTASHMPINPPSDYKPNPNLKRIRKGLVIINTGNVKGKSTAGFGMMFRAWGRHIVSMTEM